MRNLSRIVCENRAAVFAESLRIAAENPTNAWTVQVARRYQTTTERVDDIEIVYKDGVVRLGVPFFYRINNDWTVTAAPMQYVFPKGITVETMYADTDHIPPRGINLYASSFDARVLHGRKGEPHHTIVNVLRMYHTQVRSIDILDKCVKEGNSESQPMALTPISLIDDGAESFLRGALLRWWCDSDEAQGTRTPTNPYCNVAHRMIATPTLRFGPECAEREYIEAMLGPLNTEYPLLASMFLGMLQQRPLEFSTLLNQLVAIAAQNMAPGTKTGKVGRPPKVKTVSVHIDGDVLPPWNRSTREY